MSKTETSSSPQNEIIVSTKAQESFYEKYIKSDLTFNILVIIAFVALWTFVAKLVNSMFVPTPLAVWESFLKLLSHGDVEGYTLGNHIYASVIRILAGFFLACLIGIPLGLWMGLNYKLYTRSRALIEPIRFIPPIAWIPMAIVLLVGFSRYAFLIWLGAFFPIFINTLTAIPRVNPVYVNVAKVVGASRGLIVRKIIIPSVLPDIISGMRVGLGVGWMCIVAAEMIGGEAVGVGRLILKYAELLRLGEVIVGMLIIGILGFAMNEIILRVEKRLFRWRWEVSL
ncbi:MAG: ABC transporter permease [Bacillota bacterium]|jgi:ABC-type nitrate/sulfonate/bicarbonate transport system permease component